MLVDILLHSLWCLQLTAKRLHSQPGLIIVGIFRIVLSNQAFSLIAFLLSNQCWGVLSFSETFGREILPLYQGTSGCTLTSPGPEPRAWLFCFCGNSSQGEGHRRAETSGNHAEFLSFAHVNLIYWCPCKLA